MVLMLQRWVNLVARAINPYNPANRATPAHSIEGRIDLTTCYDVWRQLGSVRPSANFDRAHMTYLNYDRLMDIINNVEGEDLAGVMARIAGFAIRRRMDQFDRGTIDAGLRILLEN